MTTDGAHALRWRAVDRAGNVAEETHVVRRDTVLPEIHVNASGLLGGSGWYIGNTTVNLTATDLTSGVRHLNASVDGGAWFEVVGPFVIEGDGVHTLNVTATDAAGNELVVMSRTIRIGADAGDASADLDLVAAGDGWHRADADVAVGGERVPTPDVEGKPEAPTAPDAPGTPEAPPSRARRRGDAREAS